MGRGERLFWEFLKTLSILAMVLQGIAGVASLAVGDWLGFVWCWGAFCVALILTAWCRGELKKA